MRRRAIGPILLLLAGCTAPPGGSTAPTVPEFRAMLAAGNGSNIAVTSDSVADLRLRPRLLHASVGDTRTAVLRTVATLPRWSIVDSSGDVLWITRTTRLFRFVDDLYVLVEPREGGSAILVRSASRLGKSDFGQNRRNIAELWAALGQQFVIALPGALPSTQSPR